MNTEAKYSPLDESQPGAIRPEMLAKKIADVRRLKLPIFAKYCAENPRAVEALWFIQWMSMQPGGLAKFVADLIAFIGLRLGTESTRRFGQRKYTRAECKQVWSEIPSGIRGELEDSTDNYDMSVFLDDDTARARRALRASNEQLLALDAYDAEPVIDRKGEAERRARETEKQIFERNEPYLRQLAQQAAEAELLLFLEKLCVGDLESVSRWYCPDVLSEVIACMNARAEQVKARIAMTVVAEKVFDALEYACSERVMVRIEGESRFGKTESIETWAAMWPGRTRVVRTPSSNNERDLLKAIAEALGIHQTWGARGETLKDKVEFVIRFSGLQLIFDEGAWLLPSSFSATTAPARLNWIRSAIVDRKIPCVIVATPQSYNGAVSRFVKKTSYNIDQFLGREALRVPLPNELSHEDLLAVARVHFPAEDEDLLGLVIAKAMQSESYLKAVENIARRARYNAKKRGDRKIALRDVDTAIAEVMPESIAPAVAPVAPQARRTKQPKRVRGSRAKTVLQAPFGRVEDPFKDRETLPLRSSERAAGALSTA